MLPVGQPVTDSARGRADINDRDPAFELVMTRLVEEIAHGYDSRSFSHKVDSEPRSRASKNPDHRIKFSSSALQIGSSNGEVGPIQRGSHAEEHFVLTVPELVFACHRLRQ